MKLKLERFWQKFAGTVMEQGRMQYELFQNAYRGF